MEFIHCGTLLLLARGKLTFETLASCCTSWSDRSLQSLPSALSTTTPFGTWTPQTPLAKGTVVSTGMSVAAFDILGEPTSSCIVVVEHSHFGADHRCLQESLLLGCSYSSAAGSVAAI